MSRDCDYLIIGGGVAGTTAAETIRQSDAACNICLVGDEPYPLYSKVLLSKPEYFLGKIPEDKVFLKTSQWYADKKIDYLSGVKVVSLKPQEKIVVLENGDEIKYKKLLLATGNTPRNWNVPGAEKAGIYSLRRLDDLKKIKSFLPAVKKATAIGGGFISFEMCEILRQMGLEVTLLLRESHFWEPILDRESSEIVERAMEANGVKILKKVEVKEVLGGQAVSGLLLSNDSKIDCDMVMVSIGNYCDLDFLKDSGLIMGRGITADEFLKTNLPDVWTAGDVADFADIILEEQIELGNWANAQIQGKVAALNMIGQIQPFKFVSSYNAHGFGTIITFAGDVRPDKDNKVILRKSPDGKTIIQLFIKFGELIGATFVNGAADLPTIIKLIESDVKVSGLEDHLSDYNFDLKGLIK